VNAWNELPRTEATTACEDVGISQGVRPLGSTDASRVATAPRPWSKRLLHLLRRGHLYLGLFLFPWAILYGITGFLFNHPTAFSDQRATSFQWQAVPGLPELSWPTADAMAADVVAKLNEQQKPQFPYKIAGAARYTRELAFGTVATPQEQLSFLINPRDGAGTIRVTANQPPAPKAAPATAPFLATAARPTGIKPDSRERSPSPAATTKLVPVTLADDLQQAMPSILAQHGFPVGAVTVTSLPELNVPIEADGVTWLTTYNPLTGQLAAKAAAEAPKSELSWRRFLLRLHTAHGYPGETNARWFWAIIVDVMAFVMCFWGVTGLLMWRQIKATRAVGWSVLALSAACAVTLGYGMHALMTAN